MKLKTITVELLMDIFFAFTPIYFVAKANGISPFNEKMAGYLKIGLAPDKVVWFLVWMSAISGILMFLKKHTMFLGKATQSSLLVKIFEGSAGSIRALFGFCTIALFISSVTFFKGRYYGLSVILMLAAAIFLLVSSSIASVTSKITSNRLYFVR